MDSTSEVVPSREPKPYICEYCARGFTIKSNVKRHVIRMHKIRPVKHGSMKCPVSTCEFWCESRRDLRIHLHEPKHNVSFNCYKRTFISLEDFLEWKAAEEEVTNTQFISLSKSSKRSNGITPLYYVCHRSGFHYREEASSPTRKLKRMAKINGTCPAAIRVAIFEGKVNVVYHKTHVGHNFDKQYLKLRKFEKDYIAGKLLQGFSFDKIIQDIKSDESLVGQRIKMISRKDLHNIMKSYRVEWNEEVFSDLKNVEQWVHQLKNFSSSPIIIYKPHGLWFQHLNLYKRDFMLGIMTEGQKQVLEMLPQSVVGVNCLLNSNSHGFFLIIVFILDQSGIPFPIAYCFTNRNDEVGIKAFLNAIKNQVGKIQSSLFISDHSQACYKAWAFVMGTPTKHAFYFPHLQYHWKKNLCKIPGAREKREKIYDSLIALSEESDHTQFEHLLKTFVDQVERDADLQEFGLYFKDDFLGKTDMWAFCHYFDAGLPTVVHLEEMDKKVNDVCFHDDLPKGVDLSIRELLLMTHDKVYEQITGLYRGTEFLEQKIIQNHKNNEQLYSSDIEYTDAKWRIKMSDDESTYSVQKKKNPHPENNDLYCPLCKVFLDSYFCNCIDYLIMCTICEHIHAVACISESHCEVRTSNADAAVHLKEENNEVISCKETVNICNENAQVDLTVANFEVV